MNRSKILSYLGTKKSPNYEKGPSLINSQLLVVLLIHIANNFQALRLRLDLKGLQK